MEEEEQTERPTIGVYTFSGFNSNHPRGTLPPRGLSAPTPRKAINSVNILGNPYFEDRNKVYSRDTNIAIGDIGEFIDSKYKFEVKIKDIKNIAGEDWYTIVSTSSGREYSLKKKDKGGIWNIYKRRPQDVINKALLEATQNGNLEGVKDLLKHGATVNAVDASGVSSIEHALENGYHEIVEELRRYGASMPAYLANVTTGGGRNKRKMRKTRKTRKTKKSRR